MAVFIWFVCPYGAPYEDPYGAPYGAPYGPRFGLTDRAGLVIFPFIITK